MLFDFKQNKNADIIIINDINMNIIIITLTIIITIIVVILICSMINNVLISVIIFIMPNRDYNKYHVIYFCNHRKD